MMSTEPAYVSCSVTKLMPKRYTVYGRMPRGSGSARLATITTTRTMNSPENSAIASATPAATPPAALTN